MSESTKSAEQTEEPMEEDEPMEMEIDETVPNTPIIENKRNSDAFLQLAKESPTLAVLKPPDSLVGLNNPEPQDTVDGNTIKTIENDKNKLTTVPKDKCNSTTEKISEQLASTKIDDDIEIIDVSTPIPKPKPTLKAKKRTPIKPSDDDIVILDDDDDDDNTVTSNNSTRTKKRHLRLSRPIPEVKECDVIDLVDRKKASANTKCLNYSCQSGLDMLIAPLFCLTFYQVKSTKNKQHEVCRQCFELAMVHFGKLFENLKSKELLVTLDFPIRNDTVEIDDSDSESEMEKEVEEYFEDKTREFLELELDDVISKVIAKYNLQEQVRKSLEWLKKRGRLVKDKYQEVDTMLHNIRKLLDTIHHDSYAEFKIIYESLPSIDIMDVYYPNARPVVRTPNVSASHPTITESERRSLRKTKPISYVELDDPGSSNSNSPVVIDSGQKDPKSNALESIEIPPIPSDLPPKGPIQRTPLKIGEIYYAVRFLTMGSWIQVRLTNIIKPGAIVNGQAIVQTMYCVTMEGNKQTKYPTNRLISGKEIAYPFPSPVMLDVGQRVIAVFRETPVSADVKKLKKEAFYPGIIAEPLSYSNNFRYLIFFDDGYAQYVHHKMVHLIYESSKDVWEDMHADSRPFIKKYLESYPERPMVRLRKDQTVRTEYNGKWWLATVLKIDCSLVQMFFETSNRVEWIYRGSTRLNPMFKEEQAATNRQQYKYRAHRKFTETGPYVQYTRNDSTQEQENEPIRSVARKSTTRPIITSGKVPQTVPFLPVSNDRPTLAPHTPPPSKVVYFTPRAQANTKTLYKPHMCSVKCQSYITYDVKKLKGYNPLSKPLLCGWNRVTYKHKGKREINYKAPCGRFIRNMPELHKYLRMTQSEMTVDLFDFDFWVHCLAEFVLERNSTIDKDMSAGLENVAIPVVNYVDDDTNSFRRYSTVRQPKEGVHLNLDPEFLCGCDCEDDCEDKSKCQCWKLTLQGLPYLNKNISPEFVGYTYRRLPEAVGTGIYECNSRCKCAQTCLNRVVQNPLQLKLQVFKTHNRGWGIRCLNDIPQGAFICIYAGSLLTEHMANEGGKNYGDEYLAELDYIEVVEKTKEDYEEDVVMSEEDEKEDSKSREESADEEEKIDILRGKRKNSMEDTDFVPYTILREKVDNAPYRSRLRRRTGEDGENKEEKEINGKDIKKDTKEDEDETVIVSDDEDAFREPSSFNPKNDSSLDDTRPSKYKSVRELYGEDECVYVMDAKVTGNIGRFLNHSCTPNVFVQNVFVDTHDLRFPWVAFFALTYIRAGTELTWNYNYDVGSVPGKVLYCHCSSQECRGRLL